MDPQPATMLIIDPLAAIIHLLAFGGFMLRYRQNPAVKAYLHLGLAALGQCISSGLLALLTLLIILAVEGRHHVSHDPVLIIIIYFLSRIIGSLSVLVTIMVVLGLTRTWIASMRDGVAIPLSKLNRADKVLRCLRIIYPVLIVILIAIYVPLILFGMALFMHVLICVMWLPLTLIGILQCSVVVWMYLSIRGQNDGNPSIPKKRSQLLKLLGLTVLGAWPAIRTSVWALPAILGGFIVSACLVSFGWLWYGIALWPRALVALDEPAQPAVGVDKDPAAPV